jgi:hypothetical protein
MDHIITSNGYQVRAELSTLGSPENPKAKDTRTFCWSTELWTRKIETKGKKGLHLNNLNWHHTLKNKINIRLLSQFIAPSLAIQIMYTQMMPGGLAYCGSSM